MNKVISPGKISGKILCPPSKSMMQRAVALAILSEEPFEIFNPSLCNDGLSALEVAKAFGKTIEIRGNSVRIFGKFEIIQKNVNVGESGLGIRMFTVLAALTEKEVVLQGKGSLLTRPIDMLEAPLKQLGAQITSNAGLLPVKVCGPMKGGEAIIDGSVSSQQVTGLLLSLPFAKNNSILRVKNLISRPYVDITIELLQESGICIKNNNYEEFFIEGNQQIKKFNYSVEGDWSSAAFLLVAGAIGGRVEVKGLEKNSLQADKKIIEALEKAGSKLVNDGDSWICSMNNLNAFEFDANHCPDLFPPLTVLAANCKGTSVIKGASRLIHKESNRAEVLKKEFKKLGINIEVQADEMIITGGKITGGKINSRNDHRIAMAGACMAINAEKEITILGAEAVAKSWPEFFADFCILK